MEFIEENDIKEEVDMDNNSEGQADLIPDCHNWKLNPNLECRVTPQKLGNMSLEVKLHRSNETHITSTVEKGIWLEPDIPHHVDLDLSDMFLIQKTIKVEPTDFDMNFKDPLELCDLNDLAPNFEIKPEGSKSWNILGRNPDLSIESLPVDPDKRENQTLERSHCDNLESPITDMNTACKQLSVTHTEIRPHKCELCNKSYGKRCQLNQHKLTHNGEKPHMCDVCGKYFALNQQLTQHKVIHTGVKPHKCDACGKDFAQHGHLKRHMVTHTGVKQYKCEVCGRRFTQSGDLNSHKLTHTGEKPHRCHVCGKDFVRRSNLKRHLVTHNGIQEHN